MYDVQIPHWLGETAPKIAKWDTCRGACTVYHVVGLWHPCKPCRCCLTAALDVLLETLLLEFCRIVVFGLPTSLFPWQFQHRQLFRHAIKAKVNGQTALFYAALQVTPEAPHRTVRQVRVKQMRCSQWAVLVRRDAVEGFTVPCCVSGRSG